MSLKEPPKVRWTGAAFQMGRKCWFQGSLTKVRNVGKVPPPSYRWTVIGHFPLC